MNRKRLLTIVGVVGLLVVVGIAIAVISVWPMISGDQVAAGPAPSEEELAAASLTAPEAAAETVAAPASRSASTSRAPTEMKASPDAADLIVGHWICLQANDLQPEYSEYYFGPSEDGATGQMLYYDDPSLDPSLEDSWVQAEYELTDDGVLVISPITVGLVEREYDIGFQEEEYQARTYLWMGMASRAEGDEDMDPAWLIKIESLDPAWDEWIPDPLAGDVFAWATDDEFSLAEELTSAHYPDFAAYAALVEAGDPEDEDYAGDRLMVYAGIPEGYAQIVTTYYIASDEQAEPVWLDSANMPDNYELGETDDGTQYIWDSASLAALQEENIDPVIVQVVEWVSSDFPGGWVYGLEVDDESAQILATKWDAYPMLPDAGFFELEYSYNADDGWWELDSSSGP